MTIEYTPRDAGSRSIVIFKNPERRTVASYERELTRHRHTEIGLREVLPEKMLCFVRRMN